ncbi:hypothetical protein [Rhizobium sp. PAMB 3182]
MMRTGIRISLAAMALAAAQPAAATGEAAATPPLQIELNKLTSVGGGCRMTFVTSNHTGAELKKAAFEVVLFDSRNLVDRLTVFNFGELPDGKTVVKQFDLKDGDCTSFSRLLINGAAACDGLPGGVEACNGMLETANRTDLQFGK